jgi:Tfp pilus assembly protein PilF
MHDLTIQPVNNLKAKVILAVVIILTLIFAWFAIRWQLSEMFAAITKRDDPNAAQIADLALRWAPSNPAASKFRAQIGEDLSSADTRTAVEIAEETVRLAPNDYRWRVELARTLAQDEQFARAEDEFKRAADLAPSYAVVRWHYGNFLLRQERVDEAFAQLKIAAAGNGFYRDQVFSLAWDYFAKDASRLESLASDNTQSRTQLAYFFAARGRAEDALRNWNLLSDEEKEANASFLKVMAQGVFEQGYFPQAMEFEKQLGFDEDVQPETITNGSFEKILNGESKSRFSWQITRNIPKFEIASDQNVKHTGNRSVRVTFRGFDQPSLSNISQIVVVAPQRKYRLRFWVRTENLKSAGTPLIEVLNAKDNRSIARTPPFATGSNDWQEIALDFTTPENCNAISIRTIRAFCGEDCPITGTFWYDDFELQK